MMLAAAGGALAAAIAWLLIRYFQSLLPDRYTAGKYLVQLEAIRMDPRVIGFALAAALLTGFVFGLIPVWRASKPDMNSMLKDATRGAKGGRRGRRVQEILVVTEVSVALVMVVGAVLLIRSFMRLYGQSLGMRTQNVISLETQLPYWEVSARLQKLGLSNEAFGKRWDSEFQKMDDQVLDALRKVPGVQSAGMTTYVPMTGWYRRADFTIEDRPAPAGATMAPQAIPRIVSSSYFETLGIPLIQGRIFGPHDHSEAPPVVVITEEMARRYWRAENPIGKRLKWADSGPAEPWLTIVGVAGNVLEDGLSKPPQPIVYIPVNQQPVPVMWLVLRTRVEPFSVLPAVRNALR
jgi:putative ABC transport system permease protein